MTRRRLADRECFVCQAGIWRLTITSCSAGSCALTQCSTTHGLLCWSLLRVPILANTPLPRPRGVVLVAAAAVAAGEVPPGWRSTVERRTSSCRISLCLLNVQHARLLLLCITIDIHALFPVRFSAIVPAVSLLQRTVSFSTLSGPYVSPLRTQYYTCSILGKLSHPEPAKKILKLLAVALKEW